MSSYCFYGRGAASTFSNNILSRERTLDIRYAYTVMLLYRYAFSQWWHPTIAGGSVQVLFLGWGESLWTPRKREPALAAEGHCCPPAVWHPRVTLRWSELPLQLGAGTPWMVGAPLGLHNSFGPYGGEGVCSSHLALSGRSSPCVAAACVTKCSLCVHIRLMKCLQLFFTPHTPP